jgi:methyltransferase
MLNHSLLIAVVIVCVLRLAEIILGDINAHRMLRQGGKEFARWQRPVICLIYTVWLAGLLTHTPTHIQPSLFILVLFVALQLTRWWAIAHLGKFWTTRIVIVPLAFKITDGPYRFLRHPIYAVLIAEIMALSLAYQQLGIGCLFTGLTAWWVHVRTRAESRALRMML